MIKNGLRFNGFYSKNYLPKIKDRTYAINLDEFKSIRKHWIVAIGMHLLMQPTLIALELNICQKKFENFMRKRTVIKRIYRIQTLNSIMCGYLCSGFINFMIKEKSLLVYNN